MGKHRTTAERLDWLEQGRLRCQAENTRRERCGNLATYRRDDVVLCTVHSRAAFLANVFPLTAEELAPPPVPIGAPHEDDLDSNVVPWERAYSAWQYALPNGGRRTFTGRELEINHGQWHQLYADCPADWWPVEQVEERHARLREAAWHSFPPHKGPRQTAYWLWKCRNEPEKTAAIMILATLHGWALRGADKYPLLRGIHEHFQADLAGLEWHHNSQALPETTGALRLTALEESRRMEWRDMIRVAVLNMETVGFHYALVCLRSDQPEADW